MGRIQEILAQFEEASEHPYRTIDACNADKKKVIGLAPYFAPYELVHAAGMYPVELWGRQYRCKRSASLLPGVLLLDPIIATRVRTERRL